MNLQKQKVSIHSKKKYLENIKISELNLLIIYQFQQIIVQFFII